MKIRDLRQYVSSICDTDSFEKLGTSDDALLSRMYGLDQGLDATIGGVAAFASHSEEQLFYEFVQNAYDASATALMFFINEDYLVVLNNGEPFYTDRDRKKRNGQLYSFLAKGKSAKYNDPELLGKHGQGSKLLYTLLIDKSIKSNSEQLIKALIEERKAPYLISWYDIVQLQNLLLLKNDWSFTDPEDETEGMLVTKILYSYYPISPGVDESLFSYDELKSAIKAFEELVDPKRNMNRLQQGSALIIPLGQGQFESITSEKNVQRVLTRLGGFSSITSDKDYNHGKHIDHIYVFGNEVEQHPVRSINIEFSEEEEVFQYQFAFNPVFANEGYVNFFKGLPILEAKYGLGFIIDSQKFDDDNSRQRITDNNKTGEQLRIAFRILVEKLRNLKSENAELFDYIYESIISSDIPDGEDYDFIRSAFQEEFSEFLKSNVRTIHGEYVHIDTAQYTSEKLEWIPIEEIGTNRHWVSTDIRKKYDRCGVKGITRVGLSDLLLSADGQKLSKWILSLDKALYEKFHNIVVPFISKGNFADIKLFRSNKGNIYSPAEILDKDNAILIYQDDTLGGLYNGCDVLEYICQPIALESEKPLLDLLAGKIKANEELFATNPASQECTCFILKAAHEAGAINRAYISGIAILQNHTGKRVAFGNLLLSRPNGTSIYDHFLVRGYKPTTIVNDWCVSTPEAYWQWTKDNIDVLCKVEDWAANPEKCLKDISSVYHAQQRGDGRTPADTIELYLDDNGIPTNEKKYRLFNAHSLTNEEYQHLREVFSSAGIILQRFAKPLNTIPFKLSSLSVFDLHEKDVPVDNMVLSAFFKMNDNLLGTGDNNGYHISPSDEQWLIEPLQPQERNYIGYTEEPTAIDTKLSKRGFFRIDSALLKYITGKESLYKFSTNDKLAKHAINAFISESRLFLLPIIDKCNEDVKKYYFDRLGLINIDSSISEDSEEWAVIKYGMRNQQYRQTIFNALRHNNQHLPQYINSSHVECNGQVYSIYDLDEDVKIENESIETFLSLVPAPSEFKEVYYEDRENEISADDLYQQLHDQPLSITQMLFCLDYSLSNEDIKFDGLKLQIGISLSDMLDAIKEREMIGFNRYYRLPGFDIEKQFFADNTLLIESEQLPTELYSWYSKNSEGVSLFDGAHTSTDVHIAIRQAFLKGDAYRSVLNDVKVECLINTLEWISKQQKDVIESSNEYNIVNTIILALPKGFEGAKYLLRYVKAIQNENNALSVYRLERVDADYHILYEEDRFVFSRRLFVSNALSRLVSEKHLYHCQGIDIVHKYKLDNDRRWRVSRVAKEDDAFNEWGDSLYKEWYSLYRIKILLSAQEIAITFSIVCGSEEVFAENIKNAEFGYSRNSFVVLKYPNSDRKSVVKTIESHLAITQDQALLGWFQKPFIALQGMFLDRLDELERIAEDKGLEVKDFITEYTATPASKEDKALTSLTNEQKKKLSSNIDSVLTLCDQFTDDDLTYLKDNLDKIREMMSDEKDEQSQVRQIIGYIGELIYEHYLKEKLRVNYEFSADNGVGEYDFKYTDTDGHAVYVDVKTNLYSLKDGNSPFYLHRTQNGFMHANPQADYRIVRISLKDLHLDKGYADARDVHGKDQDPRVNQRLNDECRRIAKNYWRMAKIEEFTSDSPEYAIRIERR